MADFPAVYQIPRDRAGAISHGVHPTIDSEVTRHLPAAVGTELHGVSVLAGLAGLSMSLTLMRRFYPEGNAFDIDARWDAYRKTPAEPDRQPARFRT